MKKLLLAAFILAVAHNASAQTTGTRELVCTDRAKDTITFGICGVHGCTASVKVKNVTKTYTLNRKKNTDGSLLYTPRAGARSQCTIGISTLHNGLRSVTQVSCGSALKGASCDFKDI